MKKTTILSLLLLISFCLVGFSPDKGFDYAEYKRLPFEKRITRLQKAGEDLFLRRRYEDAVKVFETILKLKENDLSAKLWMSKAQYELKREQDEANKVALYKKYDGHLLPEDKIYINWKFGPEIGHFEVRYSEPKPRPVYKKKNRPRATDEEINAAIAKAKNGNATDTFELAMLYWSRKDVENALKYYYKASEQNSEILANDDEDLISITLGQLESRISAKTASAADYFEAGRINLLQSNVEDGINYLLKAGKLERNTYQSHISKIISDYLDSLPQNNLIANPDVHSFRQAYVHDKGEDLLYLYINTSTRNRSQIFFIDMSFPYDMVTTIKTFGNLGMQCLVKPGIDGTARVWFILPEKESNDFSSYEIKCSLKLDRNKSDILDLSNYAMSDLFDNWSFIIGNEVNFTSLGTGVNEFIEEGLRVSGYHLYLYEGRGPYIKFADFTEDIPSAMNIKDMFALMIPMEYELEKTSPLQSITPPTTPPVKTPPQTAPVVSETPKTASSDDKPSRPNVVYDIDNGTGNLSSLNGNSEKVSGTNKNETPSLPAGDINDMDIGL